jgi:hypothetical protein
VRGLIASPVEPSTIAKAPGAFINLKKTPSLRMREPRLMVVFPDSMSQESHCRNSAYALSFR